MKIIQAKDDNDEVDQALGNEVHSNQRTKMTSNQDSKLKYEVKILIAYTTRKKIFIDSFSPSR